MAIACPEQAPSITAARLLESVPRGKLLQARVCVNTDGETHVTEARNSHLFRGFPSPCSLPGHGGNQWTEKLRNLGGQNHSSNEVILSPPSGAMQWNKFAMGILRVQGRVRDFIFFKFNSKSVSCVDGKKLRNLILFSVGASSLLPLCPGS